MPLKAFVQLLSRRRYVLWKPLYRPHNLNENFGLWVCQVSNSGHREEKIGIQFNMLEGYIQKYCTPSTRNKYYTQDGI